MRIGRDEEGVLCFFMGCGGVVEHHCLVSGTMIRELESFGEEEHDEGTTIQSDDDRDMAGGAA